MSELGVVPDDAGKLLQLFIHGGDQRFLVLVEERTPLALGLQIDKVFGVEKTGGVGAVVGPSGLADDLRDLGKGGHHQARLVGEVDARGGAFAGGQCSTHPDGTLVEMGQKLRSDGAAEGQENGNSEQNAAGSQRDVAVQDGRADRGAIVSGEPFHEWILPLFCAFLKGHSAHDRRHQHGKKQRADQREGDGPGHGLEEAALDGLQGEDGQIRGDDDAAGIEDRPLHLVRGIADSLCRSADAVFQREMADHVFDHHHGAIDHHAEVQRSQRQQIGGNVDQVEANGGKQQ